ncbi:MAG: ABC transporter transmembrane domain-containing protein, partial [Nannocystaceae bacterium]
MAEHRSQQTKAGATAQGQDASEKVPNDGESWARVRRLFSYARPYGWRLVAAIVCLLGASSLGLVYPYYFGELANAAFSGSFAGEAEIEAARAQVATSTLVLLAVFLGQAVFIFFRHYLMTWLGERVVADLRIDLYRHLTTMAQAFFLKTRTGELLSRLGDDVTRLQHTVGQDLSMAVRNTLTLVGGISILLYTNATLALAMLAVVPALVITAGIWSRVIRKLSRKAQDELAQA